MHRCSCFGPLDDRLRALRESFAPPWISARTSAALGRNRNSITYNSNIHDTTTTNTNTNTTNISSNRSSNNNEVFSGTSMRMSRRQRW